MPQYLFYKNQFYHLKTNHQYQKYQHDFLSNLKRKKEKEAADLIISSGTLNHMNVP